MPQQLSKEINLGSLCVGDLTVESSELKEKIRSTAGEIEAILKQNTKVDYMAVIADGSIKSNITLLALATLGINCALIDHRTPSDLVARIAEQLNSDWVLSVVDDLHDKYQPEQIKKYKLKGIANPTPNLPSLEIANSGTLVIYSSGSTGIPKGIKLPWSFIRETVQMRSKSTGPYSSSTPRVINFFPISWSVGLMILMEIFDGVSIFALNPLTRTPSQLLRDISIIKPSILYLTANLAEVLAKELDKWTGETVNSIDYLFIGSGPLYWETVNGFRKLVPESTYFLANYSATEAPRIFFLKVPFTRLPTSGLVPVGTPREPENVTLKPTSDPELFEVLVANEIASGYVDESLNELRFQIDDNQIRWWISGDLVQLDKVTGNFFHRGRLDDFIKINDHSVSLIEVEKHIQVVTSSSEVAVVALRHQERMRLIALIVESSKQTKSESEIMKELRDILPSYSLPHSIFFIGEIPKTRTLKPDRIQLIKIAGELVEAK